MDNNVLAAYYDSPVGILKIQAQDGKITALTFGRDDAEPNPDGVRPIVLQNCFTQLDEYFNGKRKVFELPLGLRGTPFRQRVWAELTRIPYGETRSYKDIAVAAGNEKAVRAVGGANHHNPVSIIVPCHRVIGADGKLTGYGGEIWRKEWLLAHEKRG
ncbi:MAG: methylated-DNA--[protein]-cysteine S-methyltransferase [Defluviitaleaceae bacterium]|nr:methylated-DNA--[protein]-cysteine S-methyltransferase [Defluviitaleaceae bacterium]MCL2836870.1 methylated-DNA--[protein]-cysteine S-methyltransferase [Defluviitaleaceae bacterium]